MDKENVKALIEEWNHDPIFEDFMPVTNDALEAHLNGKYTLSVPALSLILEGSIRNLLGQRDGKCFKARLRKMQKAKGHDNETDVFDSFQMIDVICDDIFASSNKSRTRRLYPQRNIIMHGRDPHYHKDKYGSTRYIITIDHLRSEEFRGEIRG